MLACTKQCSTPKLREVSDISGQFPGQAPGRPPMHSARPATQYAQPQVLRPPPRPAYAYPPQGAQQGAPPAHAAGYVPVAGMRPLVGPPGSYGLGASQGFRGPASQAPAWQRQRR